MKVLHVTNRIYPEFNGGTEIHIRELCTQLAKEGEETIIFTQQVDESLKTISWRKTKESSIVIYRLCLPRLDNKVKLLQSIVFRKFLLIKLFLNVVHKEKPSVVHFHHLYTLSVFLPIICWYKKIPHLLDLVDYWFICPNVYMTCHGSFHRCATSCIWSRPTTIIEVFINRLGIHWLKNLYGYLKVFFHRLLWRVVLNHTNCHLAPISKKTKEIYQTNGIVGKDMVIKPCGIIVTKLPIRKRRSTLRIGYIGAIIPVKGVKVLVDAFKKIRGKYCLDLFGQNSFPGDTLATITKHDPRITLHPSFDHRDLYVVLSSIDILVIPSIWEETFGIVLQEGLAAHLPIIASQIGGLQERIIDGQNGFLVKPGSVIGLAKKLNYVLGRYQSIKVNLDYSLGQYRIANEVKQVTRLYNSLVNGISKTQIH